MYEETKVSVFQLLYVSDEISSKKFGNGNLLSVNKGSVSTSQKQNGERDER